jgi:trans-aconitate methyltransferase
MDLKSTYDKIAADWDKDHTTDDWWREGTEKFISLFPQKASVLDVGCGTGVKAKVLETNGMRVTGIDFSEAMLKIAKAKIPHARFLPMDIYDLSGLHEKFNGIFAQAILLHVPKKDVAMIIHSLVGKLNSGGYFYIAVKERREGEKEEETVKESDYGYEYERFFSYFTLKEMENHFTNEGLEIIYKSVTHSGRRNWIQLIGKLLK